MHKATSVWVFIAKDFDGDEGPIAVNSAEGVMPLFNTREANAKGVLAELARNLCAQGHPRIELRRYEPPRGNA